jgi:hypothetical protein
MGAEMKELLSSIGGPAKFVLGAAGALGASTPAWWHEYLADRCRTNNLCQYAITAEQRSACADCVNAGLTGWAPFAIGIACILVLGASLLNAVEGI